MYGRVSNHGIIIPYLSSFVGSGIRRAWRGKRGGDFEIVGVWRGGVSVGVCGEGVGCECMSGVELSAACRVVK